MSAPTFLQVLTYEVGRLQAAHPAREGELARAHALILQGMVTPTADPATAHVLSSDGAKHYTVNGSCSCQAGQHGKACKHLHAWKLYQYIAKRVQALLPAAPVVPAPVPVDPDLIEAYPDNDAEDLPAPQPGTPLPEAPVSITLKASFDGQEVLVTLRGHDFASVRAQVEAASAWLKAHAPAPPVVPQRQDGWCHVHQTALTINHGKDGRTWLSHRTAAGWCKGR